MISSPLLALVLLGVGGCSAPDAAAPDEEGPLLLPAETPVKIVKLVAEGDRCYLAAMEHLKRSDPRINPDGWKDENEQARILFKAANDEGYLLAQDEYPKGPIPQCLLDRVRETQMRCLLCRKRRVSYPR